MQVSPTGYECQISPDDLIGNARSRPATDYANHDSVRWRIIIVAANHPTPFVCHFVEPSLSADVLPNSHTAITDLTQDVQRKTWHRRPNTSQQSHAYEQHRFAPQNARIPQISPTSLRETHVVLYDRSPTVFAIYCGPPQRQGTRTN
jgi:hypothetical protein